MWLSDTDFLSGMLAAITVRDILFATVNLMSDNPGMRWDITESRETIGYNPEDGAQAKLTITIKLKSWIKKFVTVSMPRWVEQKFPDW